MAFYGRRHYGPSPSKKIRINFWILGIVLVVCALISTSVFYARCTGGSKDVVIENFDTKFSGDKEDQKYLVFTDSGVFENTDSFWRWKYNSSDVQADLKRHQGKKMRIHYYGWRSPFFSAYPNIYRVEALPGN